MYILRIEWHHLANHEILEERNPNQMIKHRLFELPSIQRLKLRGLGAIDKHDAVVGYDDVLLVDFVLGHNNKVIGVVPLGLDEVR